MKAQKVKMKLGSQSYSVIIGDGITSSLYLHIPKNTTKIVILSDIALVDKRKKLISSLKKISIPITEIPVKAGEDLKSVSSVDHIYGKLIEARTDRNSLIIALGGGTVGDVAGYVAATYMRGIKWIGLPTTLLSQVDSSIGGKTGINHKLGKNLIGAFHQPILVMCDISYLKTLSQREFVSGLGEIVKYGITFDKKFFNWLEKNHSKLLKGKPQELLYAIKKSVEWKCFIVSKDVEDRTGKREILNFGHTFGHALESATAYKKFQHGEAVIWGMRFASELSVTRGHLSPIVAKRIEQLLCLFKVPPLPKTMKEEVIFSHMKRDKKAEGQQIRFVLLDKLGSTVSDKNVTSKDLSLIFKRLTKKD